MAFEPITVPLSRPIVHGKDTFTEIVFRDEVLGKDLVAMDAVQGERRRNYAMYASMAGVPLPVILAMPYRDILKITRAAASLVGESMGSTEDEAAGE